MTSPTSHSFSIPSVALPTSQFIFQPFRCFTTSQFILQAFFRFSYVTGSSLMSLGELAKFPIIVSFYLTSVPRVSLKIFFFIFSLSILLPELGNMQPKKENHKDKIVSLYNFLNHLQRETKLYFLLSTKTTLQYSDNFFIYK